MVGGQLGLRAVRVLRRRRRQQVARAARGPAAPTGCQRSHARAARRPIIARPARGTAARAARSSYEPAQDLEHVVLGDTLREAYAPEFRRTICCSPIHINHLMCVWKYCSE